MSGRADVCDALRRRGDTNVVAWALVVSPPACLTDKNRIGTVVPMPPPDHRFRLVLVHPRTELKQIEDFGAVGWIGTIRRGPCSPPCGIGDKYQMVCLCIVLGLAWGGVETG